MVIKRFSSNRKSRSLHLEFVTASEMNEKKKKNNIKTKKQNRKKKKTHNEKKNSRKENHC